MTNQEIKKSIETEIRRILFAEYQLNLYLKTNNDEIPFEQIQDIFPDVNMDEVPGHMMESSGECVLTDRGRIFAHLDDFSGSIGYDYVAKVRVKFSSDGSRPVVTMEQWPVVSPI